MARSLALARWLGRVGFASVLAAGAGFQDASAGPEVSFFKGRTITLVVASRPGSGYHNYSILLSRHLGQHVDGKPTVAMRVMAREGGLVAANYIYNIAPRDGTIIGALRRSTPLQEIVSTPGVQFKSAGFHWLGSLDHEVGVCTAMSSSGVASIHDLRKKPLSVGVPGPSYLATFPSILKNTLGLQLNIVSYYASPGAIAEAMERGSLNAMCSSYSSQKLRNPQWFRDGKAKVILQLSNKKDPDLMDVPQALDLAEDQLSRTVLLTYVGALEMGRPFASPPGVPAGRVALLRQAFMSVSRDRAFLKEAEQSQLHIDPRSGEDVQAIVLRMTAIQPWIRAKLKDDLSGRPMLEEFTSAPRSR